MYLSLLRLIGSSSTVKILRDQLWSNAHFCFIAWISIHHLRRFQRDWQKMDVCSFSGVKLLCSEFSTSLCVHQLVPNSLFKLWIVCFLSLLGAGESKAFGTKNWCLSPVPGKLLCFFFCFFGGDKTNPGEEVITKTAEVLLSWLWRGGKDQRPKLMRKLQWNF